jgi:hypothetical protein
MTKEQAADALAIYMGAANARGVSRALTRSIDADCEAAGTNQKGQFASPATKLITYQLLYLILGREDAIAGFDVGELFRLEQACKETIVAND